MAKTIFKKTESVAIVKVSGSNVTETITLASDLLAATEIVQGTPTVGINHIQWSLQGDNGATKIEITRGGVDVLTLYDNGEVFDFSGNGGFVENTGATSDLTVTITGKAYVYLTLRKSAGYKSKIETAQFGSYDDVNGVGS